MGFSFWTPWNPTGKYVPIETSVHEAEHAVGQIINQAGQVAQQVSQQVQQVAQQAINDAGTFVNSVIQNVQPTVQNTVQQVQNFLNSAPVVQAQQNTQAAFNNAQQAVQNLSQQAQIVAQQVVTSPQMQQAQKDAQSFIAQAQKDAQSAVIEAQKAIDQFTYHVTSAVSDIANSPTVQAGEKIATDAVKQVQDVISKVAEQKPIVVQPTYGQFGYQGGPTPEPALSMIDVSGDGFIQSTAPTKEQAAVLGVPYVAPTPVVPVNPPSYVESKLPEPVISVTKPAPIIATPSFNLYTLEPSARFEKMKELNMIPKDSIFTGTSDSGEVKWRAPSQQLTPATMEEPAPSYDVLAPKISDIKLYESMPESTYNQFFTVSSYKDADGNPLILVGNNEYVKGSSFKNLSVDDANLLMKTGVEEFNIQKQQEFDTEAAKIASIQGYALQEYKKLYDALPKVTGDGFVEEPMTPEQYKALGLIPQFSITKSIPINPPAYAPRETPLSPEQILTMRQVADQVWKSLTPWDESEDETFLSFVKDYPAYWLDQQEMPSQDKLKLVYEAEKNVPWWQDFLFGKSVIQMPDGSYSMLAQGEAPMMNLASKGPAIAKQTIKSLKPFLTVAPVETGLSDANYLRFLNARIASPNLSLEGFKLLDTMMDVAVSSPKLMNKPPINIGAMLSKLQPFEEVDDLMPGIVKATTRSLDTAIDPYAMGGRPLTANWYQEVLDTIAAQKSAATTATKVKQSLNNVSQIVTNPVAASDDIAKTLISQGAISVALATKPAQTLIMLSSISPALKSIVMASINIKIANAINAGKSPSEIQKLAQDEIVTMTGISNQLLAGDSPVTKNLPNTILSAINTAYNTVPSSQYIPSPVVAPPTPVIPSAPVVPVIVTPVYSQTPSTLSEVKVDIQPEQISQASELKPGQFGYEGVVENAPVTTPAISPVTEIPIIEIPAVVPQPELNLYTLLPPDRFLKMKELGMILPDSVYVGVSNDGEVLWAKPSIPTQVVSTPDEMVQTITEVVISAIQDSGIQSITPAEVSDLTQAITELVPTTLPAPAVSDAVDNAVQSVQEIIPNVVQPEIITPITEVVAEVVNAVENITVPQAEQLTEAIAQIVPATTTQPEIITIVETITQPQVEPIATVEALAEVIAQVAAEVISQVETVTEPQVEQLVQAIAQVIASPLTETQTATATQVAVQAAIQQQSQTKTEVQTKTQLQTQPKTQAQTKTQLQTKVQTRTEEQVTTRNRIPEKDKIIIRIPLPGGQVRKIEMTKDQFNGIIAWKQGFMYKLLYPPYGKENIINTRHPINIVKYSSGPGSAYASIVAKGGAIPTSIMRDMGIFDINISVPPAKAGQVTRKATIRYRRDMSHAGVKNI
jgi:hypothetical protein